MSALPMRWFTVEEVATYTHRHSATVYRAMRSGELRASQRAWHGPWLADIADVDAWVRGERPRPVSMLAARRGPP